MTLDPLQQSICKTLAYFDLADFPLTKEELFAYLWQPPRANYDDFLTVILASSVIPAKAGIQGGDGFRIPVRNDIAEKHGYFFLPDREQIVESRRRRLVTSEIKIKIAKKAIRKIRSIPFLRAVFVCNSVGSYQAEEDSDIDFFIVAEPGRIWLVRFFSNLILRLRGLRTYGTKTKNKICLSFFVDLSHLNLAPWRVADDDIHFAYWLHQMAPVYNPENLYQRFLQANGWTEKYLLNINLLPHTDYLKKVADSRLGKIWKKAWEKMWESGYGNLLEKQAREWQIMKMKFSVKEKAEKGDRGIVLADGVIKLHENDTRRKHRENWLSKIKIYE